MWSKNSFNMGIKLVRVKIKTNQIAWGLLEGSEVRVLEGPADSLRSFIQNDELSRRQTKEKVYIADVSFLSPVTSEAQILCQGKNYLAHLIETGVKPENKEFNLIFTKAASTLAPPVGFVRCPNRVKLLDYELELGLVLKAEISSATKITKNNLHHFVAGVVMANDISARDVQVPERQWFKGKSFRGFCPVGPVLHLLDQNEIPLLYDLNLHLSVNGKTRQKANTKQLMHSPEDTLTELSEIIDMHPGDLLLTGTPGGVAMKVEKNFISSWRSKFQSEKKKMSDFIEQQLQSDRYLKNNDRIESTISSPRGEIDLGKQELIVNSEGGL